MMKCLPNCHNIDCNDRRYRKFWERMRRPAFLSWLIPAVNTHRPGGAPRIVGPAHVGIAAPMRRESYRRALRHEKAGCSNPEYFYVFSEMIRRYPNLYGDTSAFNVPIRGRTCGNVLQPPLVERMLHGSDFPVPVHGHFAWFKGYVDWKTFRRWERNPNILERDYQLKLAAGFPPETFTRIWSLLRLPSAATPNPAACGLPR
jgi:hypothetical protein